LRAALVDFYAGGPVVSVNTDDTPAELLLRRSTAPSDKLELFVFGGMEVRRRVWSPCSTIWAGCQRCRRAEPEPDGLDEGAGLAL
jgi:N-acetyl-gamma-glutamyl-phosphate reductase